MTLVKNDMLFSVLMKRFHGLLTDAETLYMCASGISIKGYAVRCSKSRKIIYLKEICSLKKIKCMKIKYWLSALPRQTRVLLAPARPWGRRNEVLCLEKVVWPLVLQACTLDPAAVPILQARRTSRSRKQLPGRVSAVSSGEITWLEARSTQQRMLFLGKRRALPPAEEAACVIRIHWWKAVI